MSATIVVIEDNPTNLYLVRYLLEERGHRVVAAATGPVGLELVRRLRPDLVLLDIQLPGMDGHAVARALKADPALAPISIVAVTSYAMPADREAALAAGIEGYLEKPIEPTTFVAEVERWLAPARDGRQR